MDGRTFATLCHNKGALVVAGPCIATAGPLVVVARSFITAYFLPSGRQDKSVKPDALGLDPSFQLLQTGVVAPVTIYLVQCCAGIF